MAQQKKYNKSNNKRNYDNRNNNRSYDNRNNNRSNNRNYDNRNRDNQNRDHYNRDNQKQYTKGKDNQAAIKGGGVSKTNTQSKAESSNDLLIFIAFLVALALFFLGRKLYFPPEQNNLFGSSALNVEFMKEGTLTFFDAQSEKKIINIEIEIAKSIYEIEQGLMHRRSLPANGGMLFVFDDENIRTFWMKDTYISLDLIFLNAEKEIIRISKNAKPLSMSSIPSGGKAMYVVEVLAGFTETYNIHPGDHIEFWYR